jgi:hypothetical protein
VKNSDGEEFWTDIDDIDNDDFKKSSNKNMEELTSRLFSVSFSFSLTQKRSVELDSRHSASNCGKQNPFLGLFKFAVADRAFFSAQPVLTRALGTGCESRP